MQKSTAMNMGALVLKNASEYIQERETGQNVKTKLFPVLARKEKFEQPTVSWTLVWANATNTTSAQTGSEVSLTFSPMPLNKSFVQVMCLVATTTLSPLTIFLEISIILKQT